MNLDGNEDKYSVAQNISRAIIYICTLVTTLRKPGLDLESSTTLQGCGPLIRITSPFFMDEACTGET